jgi:hypothetical protein
MDARFYQRNTGRFPVCAELVPVHSLSHLEYLIKECEVVTSRPGRKFVVASADRLAYRVQWHPDVYRVERLDDADNVLCTMVLKPHAFHAHSLGSALRVGCLFTPMLAD